MYRNLLVALPAVVVALGISSLVASRAFSEEDGRNVSNADRGSERPARASRESCWHPGMSRNIGIAERACDPLTPKPRMRPELKGFAFPESTSRQRD